MTRDQRLTGAETAHQVLLETAERIKQRVASFPGPCLRCGGLGPFSPVLEGWPAIREGEWPDVVIVCQCTAYMRWWSTGEQRLGTAGVYFVQCEQFVKIGHARDVGQRAYQYYDSLPFPISLLGFLPRPESNRVPAEEIHLKRWQHLRHKGEWFQADSELLSWIANNTLNPRPFIRASDVCSAPQIARLLSVCVK